MGKLVPLSRLNFVRLILGSIFLGLIGTSLIRWFAPTDFVDPISIRLVLILLMGLLLGGSFLYAPSRKSPNPLIHTALLFFLPWVLSLLYLNHLSARYVLTSLLVLSILGLALEKKKPLIAFQLLYTLGLMGVAFFAMPAERENSSGEPHMPALVLIMSTLLISSLSLLVNWVRIWYQDTLKEKLDQLSAVMVQLRESQAQQQAVFDNTMQMQLLLDTNFRILKANGMAQQVLSSGTGISSIEGKDFRDFASDETHVQEMETSFAQALSGVGATGERKVSYRGIEVFLKVEYQPAKDESGQILGVIFSAIDVSEQYQALALLEQRERKLQALLEANPDMIFRIAADGTCLDFKPAAGDLYHQKLDRIIGSNLLQAPMETGLKEELMQAIDQALASQEMVFWEYQMQIRKQLHYYEARIVPAAEGEVVALVRDVSEDRKAQKKVQESDQLIKSVLQAIPNPVFFKDEQGRYGGCNPAFEEFIGIEEKDLIGKTPFDISEEELAHVYHESDLEIMRNPRFVKYESQVKNAKGELREVSFFKSPLWGHGGEMKGLVGVILDITEQKKVHQALVQAKEKAEAASRAKADFLSTMSHEIRTPMNAVIGTANLLLEEDPRPEQEEHLETLKFSADNLLVIINDILDYNKIEAGKIELERRPVCLKKFCEQTIKSLQPKADTQGIELKLVFDAKMQGPIALDSTRMSQVLLNLLNNALKFTPQGSVTLQVSQKGEEKEGQRMLWEVIDTGIGIAREDQERIFGHFTQATSSTTREYGGTGLGLTISRHLVELFGGSLLVESELGKGARFYFEIVLPQVNAPEISCKAQERLSPSKEITPFENQKVLVVEDNLINQKIVGKYLTKWNLEVSYASNGRKGVEACEKAEGFGFDLILMDLQMPVMDGYEATREIRKLAAPKNQVPILALTASAAFEVLEQVHEVGMDDYAPKPFVPKVLHAKIKACLKKGEARKQGVLS